MIRLLYRLVLGLTNRKNRLEADEADPKDELDDDNGIDDGEGGEEADRCLESPKDRCPAPMPILRESSLPTSRRSLLVP